MAKPYVLFDSHAVRSYEDYIEFCKEDNTEPQGEDSADYFDFINCMKDIDFHDFMLIAKNSKYYKRKWAVEGTFSLWNGQKDIEPKVFDNLLDAIKACVRKCNDFKITKNCSTIEVEGTHHYGTNCFTIKCLSDLGENRYNDNGQVSLKNKENLMALPQRLF